tara:strand:+ start:6769 stop:7368 length:600 start_codon:yes stop_codon:yes gene_type:complete
MIHFININKSLPYQEFSRLYNKALASDQESIEACCISSFNKKKDEVDSRFVNLKYIQDEEWIFFSNYNSKKAEDFESYDQIAAIFYWNKINVQIRIKGTVFKTSTSFSDQHFKQRSQKKNALAISSNQSKQIDDYKNVKRNFEKVYKDKSKLDKRPNFWGGYSFKPISFEFWQGHDSRLNKRTLFILEKNKWAISFLQP